MKVLFGGDTHGNLFQFKNVLFPVAEGTGCEKIFVVGDFGFWPNEPDGPLFLKHLNDMAKRCGIKVYWLDGNHEDHAYLRDLMLHPTYDDEGFVKIRPNIWYSPRGHRWTWDKCRFLSLGGAYSIDRDSRVIGKSWFWEEMITIDDVIACGDEKVDIMLTHDIPAGVPMREIMARYGRGFSNINEAYRNTMYVRDVVDLVNPEYLIHGHYHLKYQHILDNNYTNVVGLCCDGSGRESFVVVDLSTWGADS